MQNSVSLFTFLKTIIEKAHTKTTNFVSMCSLFSKKYMTKLISVYLVDTTKEFYTIHYPFGFKWYKVIVPRKRSQYVIQNVYNHHDHDVTEEILAYMGPLHNFHNMQLCPRDLGHDTLRFIDIDDNEIVYEATQIIRL